MPTRNTQTESAVLLETQDLDQEIEFSLDDAYQFSISENPESRAISFLLSDMIVKTPRGYTQLLAMLKADDPDKAAFAINCLEHTVELNDVNKILECADKHHKNEKIIDNTRWTLSLVLGIGIPEESGSDPETVAKNYKHILQSISANESEWKGKTYAEYWAHRAQIAIDEQKHNDDYEVLEYLTDSLAHLFEVQDATIVVPFMMQWIVDIDPSSDVNNILPGLINILQMYVGPLDVPALNDVSGKQKAKESLLSWWKDNKNEKSFTWLAYHLKQRGKDLNVADTKSAIPMLISITKNGDDIERYTGSMILASLLHDGNNILIYRPMPPIHHKSDGPNIIMVQDYVSHLLMCRAYHSLLKSKIDKKSEE